MRVLVYTSIFPSRPAPIRGIYNLYLVRELARHAEVRVVCPLPLGQRLSAPRELFSHETDRSWGVPVDYPTFLPLWRVAPIANPHWMEFTTRPTVERVKRDFPFDVVFAIWGYPDAVAALQIARRARCPLVTNLLGSDANELAFRPLLRPLIAATLKASNSVVALSRAMAARIVELGVAPERVPVQYNGVHHDQFFPRDRVRARLELCLPPERPIVLYVGNLEEVKGPDILFAAFGQIEALTPQPPLLVMVGTGSLVPRLEQQITERGWSDRVRMVGRRSHDQIPLWLGAANLLCLPSRMEGCPNVVLEAFASGRPVVATRVGGVPELIEPARGVLVPPEDPGALAAGLGQALAQSWDAAAISRSAESFTWEAFGRNLAGILEAALVEGPLVVRVH